MFAKLLKYEWKASAGLLGILSGAAVIAGLLGGVCLRYVLSLLESSGENTANAAIAVPLLFLSMFLFLALIAYMFSVQIILYSRFYKSRFTDEGYLTFTLPVSTAQNYLSALTNILIWQVISDLVMALAIFALLGISLSGLPGFDSAMNETVLDLPLTNNDMPEFWLSLLLGLVSCICAPVLIMTSITLGAVLAKKHKVLAAIGMYYVVSMVSSMLMSVGSTVLMLQELEYSASTSNDTMMLVTGIEIVIQLALAVGGSFLSVRLMEKKLNLP